MASYGKACAYQWHNLRVVLLSHVAFLYLASEPIGRGPYLSLLSEGVKKIKNIKPLIFQHFHRTAVPNNSGILLILSIRTCLRACVWLRGFETMSSYPSDKYNFRVPRVDS